MAFFSLFFSLDLAFLFLALAYLLPSGGAPAAGLLKAGGAFGIIAAFLAWYVKVSSSHTRSTSSNVMK